MIRAQRAAWLVFLMKMGQNKMFVGLAGDSKRKDGSATAVNSFLSFSPDLQKVCVRARSVAGEGVCSPERLHKRTGPTCVCVICLFVLRICTSLTAPDGAGKVNRRVCVSV